ncbi:carboxypeptidase regulatory-like domain-containing protein (plasmid) [Priestia megaterium]|uniref:carboxypeptidase-like regulatory domain-containing protein n=1 Tax=Priestia megaterium TaxID=1404 RepID=UPI001EDA4B4A|nr:carboxypeptidase-like regulatory domain-containing protein [Priestia megaterium]UKJ83548.1 carboxypeptidase regulatory-like domain-containing protein [Priestia megaterium]
MFNDQGVLIASTLTDVKGQYTIFDLPAGIFTIRANSKDYLRKSKVVTLTLGGNDVVNFTLVRKAELPSVILIDSQQRNLAQGILDELFAINTNITSNRKIIINNSKDVTVLIADTDFITNSEILLQILVVLLV